MPAGIVIFKGLAGSNVEGTSAIPAVFAAVLKSIEYVVGDPVVAEYAIEAIVVPRHMVAEPLESVIPGVVFTTTFALAVAVHPFPSVTVTVYVPPIAKVALALEGFWLVDVNPDGPLQEYITPPDEDKESVSPVQTVDPDAVGLGKGFIVTLLLLLTTQLDPSVVTTETL